MSQKWVPTKPNFGSPPAGYIAGLGRGATGFVTRNDLGPAARANIIQIQNSENQDANYVDNKFDAWSGYKGALFTKQQVDEEDKQADQAFDYCQRRMEERRLKEKERKVQQQLQKQKKKAKSGVNMAISEQFTDLKRQLAKVTEEEWMNLPQSVDLSVKKRKKQQYIPTPDSMLVSYLNSNTHKNVQTVIDENQDYRDAKSALLKSNLQRAQNEAGQIESVDRVGYLTHLDTTKVDEQILGDIKRARLLHKAALKSNPRNTDIWLSSARIEQIDGKLQQCRNILYKALQNCITSQDIWLELSRVQRPEQSKNILIQGLRNLPKSQKLWLVLARKQNLNKQMKSKVLRRGLQSIPNSTKLWKQLIQLEDIKQAKSLLYKAVECLPKQIDLWIGLAKLQTYQNAKQILNKARKANPLNLAIWISAAKLEQTQLKTSHSNQKAVNKIEQTISKGRQILKKNGNIISRQQLLQEALICQKSDNLITCQSIVKAVISLGLTEDELNYSLFKDVEMFQKQYGSIHTTRFIYKHGVLITKNIRLLQKMVQYEQRLGILDIRQNQKIKKSKVMESLKFGLKVFPDYGQFWLIILDKLIDHQNYQQALQVIKNALQNIQYIEKQKIIIKYIYILKKNNHIQQAKLQISKLRSQYPNSILSIIEQIWFEYHIKNYEEAWNKCSIIFKQKIKNEDIWELAFKIKNKIGSYQQCKNLGEKAVLEYPNSIKLWKMLIQLQLSHNFQNKARTIIDKALMKNSKNQQLYLILIQLQLKIGNKKQINNTVSRALKQCPKCGQIWAIAIVMESYNTRKKKASIAIQQCGNNSSISCAVAKLFWKDNKIQKSKKWLQDALQLDKTNGDIWSYYYKLIIEHYPNKLEQVKNQFLNIGKITHGIKWFQIKQCYQDGWKFNNLYILNLLVQNIGDQIYQME